MIIIRAVMSGSHQSTEIDNTAILLPMILLDYCLKTKRIFEY